jgi:hypothetical protein
MLESEVERDFVQFRFSQQAERYLASVEDVIDSMREAGKQVGRIWVSQFAKRNAEKLALPQATVLEADRRNVHPDEIRANFDCCKDQPKTIPLMFIWNTRMRREWGPQRSSRNQT